MGLGFGVILHLRNCCKHSWLLEEVQGSGVSGLLGGRGGGFGFRVFFQPFRELGGFAAGISGLAASRLLASIAVVVALRALGPRTSGA